MADRLAVRTLILGHSAWVEGVKELNPYAHTYILSMGPFLVRKALPTAHYGSWSALRIAGDTFSVYSLDELFEYEPESRTWKRLYPDLK